MSIANTKPGAVAQKFIECLLPDKGGFVSSDLSLAKASAVPEALRDLSALIADRDRERADAETAARMAAETIAAQQAALLDAEHRLDRLIADAGEVLDDLDDRADVTDGPDGRPAPSWTMSLANTLRDALTAARR